MKRLFLAGVLALFGTVAVNAQRVQKGETQLNAGVGFNSGYYGTPIYAGVDYGVHPDITVGASASYVSFKPYANDKASWFGVGVNGNYHFNRLLSIPNNWDLYAGLTLAYNSFSYDNKDVQGVYSVNTSGIGLVGQVGARYYFTEKFGLNVEFGGGDIATGGKVGISYKF